MVLVTFVKTIDELRIVHNYMCKQFNEHDIPWISQYFNRSEWYPLYIGLDITARHQPVYSYSAKQFIYNMCYSDCTLAPIDACLFPENYPELFI